MSENSDLPSLLVAHVIEAWDEGDTDRILRIARKAERRGADLVPELAEAYKFAESLPHRRARAVRAAVQLLSASTRCIEGMALVLRDFAETPGDDLDTEIEEIVADDPALWVETARALLPTAREEENASLLDVCTSVLARADHEMPGILDLLVAELDEAPRRAVDALTTRDDPAAGVALRTWLRAQSAIAELDPVTCGALSHAGETLIRWETALDQSDLDRIGAASKRYVAHLENSIQSMDKMIRAADTKLAARTGHQISDRTMFRTESGPNASCECGSGRKRKKCCG